ncbi:MAG TPA: hypothetical protein VM124_03655 [Candidatus Limnocylindrales bacterium]|nr:hypothetical protein [Candidatus Limnocylindrales bacterium]
MPTDLPQNNDDPDELIVNDTGLAAEVSSLAELEADPGQGETHPVFGSKIQPQEIHDQHLVGSDEITGSLRGEDRIVNFDPEQDPRLQAPPIA